jgi:hypothetical protein
VVIFLFSGRTVLTVSCFLVIGGVVEEDSRGFRGGHEGKEEEEESEEEESEEEESEEEE